MSLAAEQGYQCALSGLPITPDNAVLDHKVPVSRGGMDVLSNLQWVHADANRMKGDMDMEEFKDAVLRTHRRIFNA